MICFKDKTFCAARCSNMDCPRQFTDKDKQDARKWWGDAPGHAPIAFSDFSDRCDAYEPKGDS